MSKCSTCGGFMCERHQYDDYGDKDYEPDDDYYSDYPISQEDDDAIMRDPDNDDFIFDDASGLVVDMNNIITKDDKPVRQPIITRSTVNKK